MKLRTRSLLLVAALVGLIGTAGYGQGAVGAISNLLGKVDNNNALVISLAASSGSYGSVGAIGNQPGKTDSNNALVVTCPDGTCGSAYSRLTQTGTSTLDVIDSSGGVTIWRYDLSNGGALTGYPITWGATSTGTQDVGLKRAAAASLAVTDGSSGSGSITAKQFIGSGVTFASLGTPANGTFAYCSDCTVANPCASGGTGALAKRLNGAWVCN